MTWEPIYYSSDGEQFEFIDDCFAHEAALGNYDGLRYFMANGEEQINWDDDTEYLIVPNDYNIFLNVVHYLECMSCGQIFCRFYNEPYLVKLSPYHENAEPFDFITYHILPIFRDILKIPLGSTLDRILPTTTK